MSKRKGVFDDQVIELYNKENKSTYEIAELLDTYPNKIRRTLIRHGYTLKDKSEAQRLALKTGRTDHPTEGKERTIEEKIKISSGLVSHWETISDKERSRRSKAAKDRWKNMSLAQKHEMSVKGIEAIRKAAKEGSKLEKYIRSKIQDAGFRVIPHDGNVIPTEKLEVDLHIPELNTIIEVDGPSHCLPVWGEEKLQKQINADLRKDGIFLTRGYVVIRVKSSAIGRESLKDKDNVSNIIVNHLNNIKKKFPPKSKRLIEVEL